MSRPVATVRALVLVVTFTVSATTLHSAPPDPQVEALYRQGRAALDSYVNDPDDRSHGRLEEALSAFDCVVALNPSHVDALVARAKVHFHSDRYQEAIDDANRAIELDPKSAAAYCIRGRARGAAERDSETGMPDLNKAIELDPKLAEAYYGRGANYYNDKKMAKVARRIIHRIEYPSKELENATLSRLRIHGQQGARES